MMRLCDYTEYGSQNGVSMKTFFQEQPYPGIEKIIYYLRNNGQRPMVRMEMAKDRVTGERIKGEMDLVCYTDGCFSWWSDLAYHVEKYNLRLPKEFEDYVLSRS